jgi:hypothetical protein
MRMREEKDGIGKRNERKNKTNKKNRRRERPSRPCLIKAEV